MKLLIDNALSPIFASKLREARCDILLVRERDMQVSSDEEILKLAAREDRVIVSADTDFGTLLVLRKTAKPSSSSSAGLRDGVPSFRRSFSWSICRSGEISESG